MNPNNAKFLDDNKGIYTTLVNAGFIQNLTNETRQELLRITREEFSPGYLCCMHCNADIAALVKYVFHQYEVWQQNNPLPKPKKKIEKSHKNIS
jgi:hypothetical protein